MSLGSDAVTQNHFDATKLHGVLPALPTPFKQGGAVDEEENKIGEEKKRRHKMHKRKRNTTKEMKKRRIDQRMGTTVCRLLMVFVT